MHISLDAVQAFMRNQYLYQAVVLLFGVCQLPTLVRHSPEHFVS